MDPLTSTPSRASLPEIQRSPPASADSASVDGQATESPVGPQPEESARRGYSDGCVWGTTSRRDGATEGSSQDCSTGRAIAGPPRHPAGPDISWDFNARALLPGHRERVDTTAADQIRRMSHNPDYTSRQRAVSTLSPAQMRDRARDQMREMRRQRSGFTGLASEQASLMSARNQSLPFTHRDLDRPLPRTPDDVARQASALRPQSSEITVPQWQPDAEVTRCPICQTTFSFWYRKHHCRKCGRVVCANCSPHRITIPRQFLVHPPDEYAAAGLLSGFASQRDEPDQDWPLGSPNRIDPALGGGQEVRLCNPCVPDPNPNPFPLQTPNGPRYGIPYPGMLASNPGMTPADNSGRGSLFGNSSPTLDRTHSGRLLNRPDHGNNLYTSFSRLASSPPPPSFNGGSPADRRHRRGHRHSSSSIPVSDSPGIYGSNPDQSHERYLDYMRTRHGPPPHHPRHHRYHASLGQIPNQPNFSWPTAPVHPAIGAVHRPPQPQLREEDECPVCHGALPPKGADGSETDREAHVQSCIEEHFSTSRPRDSQISASSAVDAAVAASAATPSQAAGAGSSSAADPERFGTSAGTTAGVATASPSTASFFKARRRTTGMVVYSATEKDCVGENGEGEAECVICFEEFAVGDEMGRLECLCKFHKSCIRQWWDTKGPGACPVHQQQEES